LGEHNDLPSAKTAYVVQLASHSILFAADSNCLDASMYEHVRKTTGPVDILFVGMEFVGAPLNWVYGPILPIASEHRHSQERRSSGCNADHATKLARALQCRQVFIYALGREPWIRHLLGINPSDDDIYMIEVKKFMESLIHDTSIKAERLFGKAEIFI